ncbi:lytic transglycosylase domain-containing protein [Pandoraea anhela]|uniref:Membrane-bound lytic murein transglycosylase C n=1 Tax=Pandoraea anhela TaxID=2508295 RepID=A0A5E4YJV2_9BURK|nr:lytic transglycosylase domain-containing protein [Pandoraea anhela]VVE48792.1 Membrane-bound lytic murein transglycosylase C [Pandoraea anhela]
MASQSASQASSASFGTAPAVSPPFPEKLPFDALVRRAAHATSVDAALLHAIIDTESGYDPQAVSERGAIGLMQVLPRTGQRFGVRRLEDPAENLRAGAAYVRWLLSRFDGDVSLALAAYNAGEGAVLRYGRQVPPFPETQKYVRRVMAGYTRLRRQREAGVSGTVSAVGTVSTVNAVNAVSAAGDDDGARIGTETSSRGGVAPGAIALTSASASAPASAATAVGMPPAAAALVSSAREDGTYVAGGVGGAAAASRARKADDVETSSETDERAKSARAWRLLRGLGELITRSPDAGGAPRVGKAMRDRDRPAVVMPSSGRGRTTGAALRPAGRDAGASTLPG